jgi:HlyD family type I secretion membrane fusion protein
MANKPAPSSASRLRRMLMPTLLLALASGTVMFGSLGTWASRAPLASAAIAPGNVSPDSGRQPVQHFEGGILREIRVVEGSQVKKDSLLFTLEPIQARSQVQAKRQQWVRLQIIRARLEAHWAEATKFTPPDFPAYPPDESVKAFTATQVALFNARRNSFIEREQILNQQIEQLKQQHQAKTRENESLGKQRAFLEEEIVDKKELIAKNLARKPEWLALERARADVIGRMESNNAEFARIAERTREIELSIVTNRTAFQQEISDLLVKTNTDISQLEETLPANEDVLKRTDILAPFDGTITALRFKTVGGVVKPGETLTDLVPINDDLFIDAKLSPNDIDVVHVGLPAEVYLTPYVSRHMPRLMGTVTRVGADVVKEQTPGPSAMATSYFDVRVKIDKEEIRRANVPVMSPGMPAEVYILTGTRTFAQYFLDPVTKSFRRAFRED